MSALLLLLLAVEPGPGLELLNKASAVVRVELTEKPEPIAPGTKLMNQKAPKTAKVKSVKLDPLQVPTEHHPRALTPAELDSIVFVGKKLTLSSFGVKVEHTAPNGKHFTLRDMTKVIEATELEARAKSDWYEGIDVHHVFFEGMQAKPDGTYEVHWGS